MKARSILFSSPMIHALLDGRKTQTRRIVKCPGGLIRGDRWSGPAKPSSGVLIYRDGGAWDDDGELPRQAPIAKCPYGQPGDLLWVRESFHFNEGGAIRDAAGGFEDYVEPHFTYMADHRGDARGLGWKPSIHMPRWASRLTLELTDVRVGRKQDISVEDAIAEGLEPVPSGSGEHCGWLNYLHKGEGTGYCTDPRDSYATLTDSINGLGSWDRNDWVWCLSFRVHQKNVDALLAERGAA